MIAASLPALAGAVTGKIVIDGVEYDASVVRGNRHRTLPCFQRIRVQAAVDVFYQQPAARCEARLIGDANLLDRIDTQVQGDEDELVIDVNRSL